MNGGPVTGKGLISKAALFTIEHGAAVGVDGRIRAVAIWSSAAPGVHPRLDCADQISPNALVVWQVDVIIHPVEVDEPVWRTRGNARKAEVERQAPQAPFDHFDFPLSAAQGEQPANMVAVIGLTDPEHSNIGASSVSLVQNNNCLAVVVGGPVGVVHAVN